MASLPESDSWDRGSGFRILEVKLKSSGDLDVI